RTERSSIRWAPWWTPAWSARRTVPGSRASHGWRPSAVTPVTGCGPAAGGRRRTTGMRGTSSTSQSPPRPSGKRPATRPGVAAVLDGTSEVPSLDGLEAEHDNRGAGMSWFLDKDKPGLAHQLGAATWRFWWLRGHAEEFARYGQAIVANGEKLPPGQLGYAQN